MGQAIRAAYVALYHLESLSLQLWGKHGVRGLFFFFPSFIFECLSAISFFFFRIF